MKYRSPFFERLHAVLLLAIIVTGLINSEYFYTSVALAYYGFCVIALFFTITSYFYSPLNKAVRLKTPFLCFGLWCCYVLLHSGFKPGSIFFLLYIIIHFLLLIRATAVFSQSGFNFNRFFKGIAGIATLESLYCIGQYLGWFKSQNNLYVVTGNWVNPNVTALFLALTIPVFLFLFRSKQKKIIQTGFITLLIALALLKCRTALIGAAFSTIVFYSLEYQFIDWIKNKKNRSTAKALAILGLLIIIPLSTSLYNSKKASADGRKFIWKLSTLMALEKPLKGYGYGYFEKEYNLFQANYIKNGKATPKELENAGSVVVAHNEVFQNVVEGGLIGLLLISLFFSSLLFALKRRKNIDVNEVYNTTGRDVSVKIKNSYFNLSYATVIGFIAMSIFEFTIQAVPVMSMLTIYAAIICSTLKPLQLPSKLSFFENNKLLSTALRITMIAISMYVLYLIIGIAAADRKNKTASLLKKEGHYEEALKIMPDLEPYLKGDKEYWGNYGSLYYHTHNYPAAISCLEKAVTISTSPELFLGLGACYEQLKQYPAAITQYKQLVLLHPAKFNYRYRLMNAYLNNKDTLNTIAVAQGILDLRPKIPSEKVMQYKSRAAKVLKSLGPKQNASNRVLPLKQTPQFILNTI